MINLRIIEELANKLAEVLPNTDGKLKQDLEKNFSEILKSAFKKMDLVSAEEFNVQKLVLASLEQKTKALEDKIKRLETEKLK